MTWFSGFLKERYLLMKRKIKTDHLLHFKMDLCSTLLLVYNREFRSYRKTIEAVYLYGNADESGYKSQFLDSVLGGIQKTILIEGESGVGKTTFVKEMCIRWAEGNLKILVLLLLLSNPSVQSIATLQQLLEYFVTSTSQAKQLSDYLEETQGAGVTIIVDGLDEMKKGFQSSSFFTKLISGKILLKAVIILTSRPFALGYYFDDAVVNLNEIACHFMHAQNPDKESEKKGLQFNPKVETSFHDFLNDTSLTKPGSLHLHDCVDRVIKIVGFDQSGIDHFAHQFFQNSPSKLEGLQKHLQEHPHINALCHNPMIMSMILFICTCQLEELPTTMTKLYTSFIINRVGNCLKKLDKLSGDNEISELEDFPNEVTQVLKQLENIAFDGLLKDRHTFTIEELPAVCKDDPSCFGLLYFEQYSFSDIGNNDQTFTFLSRGMQEYFAAKHVTHLPDDEVYTLLYNSFLVDDSSYYDYSNPNSMHVQLSNMWIMYCGIAGAQYDTGVPVVMRDFLLAFASNSDPSECLHNMYQSLSSVSSSTKYPSINHDLSGHHIVDKNNITFLIFRCFEEAQDYKLSAAISLIFHSYVHLVGTSLLPHQMTSVAFFISKLISSDWESLNLSDCNISDHGICILHHYLCGNKARKYEIRTVSLNNNNLTEASSPFIGDIIAQLQPHHLELNHNKIKFRDVFFAMKENYAVKVLEVIGNDITVQDADAVSDMIAVLENLNISDNILSCDGATLLSKGIAITNTLTVLNVDKNNIGFKGYLAIMNSLANNFSLNKLSMNDNIIGKDGVQASLANITSNKNLRELSVNNNYFGHLEATVIVKTLINCESLEKLHMCHNVIGQDGANAIALIIIDSSALKEIYINNNQLGPSRSKIIMQALTLSKSVETLHIENNALGRGGAMAVAKFLTNNSVLKELWISNNNFGASGAAVIARGLAKNTSLQVLHMRKNNIGQSGALAFATSITKNKTLMTLSLSYDNTIIQ